MSIKNIFIFIFFIECFCAAPWSLHNRELSAQELRVSHPLRLMVFAPHPDDEVIGAGGLMQRVLAAGGKVRIVVLSNGDGYLEAAAGEFHRRTPAPFDYLALGQLRERETTRALLNLGLQPSDVRFLGFPDGGLGHLWNDHWSARLPYLSPFTKVSHTPYAATVKPNAAYDGQDLTSMIVRQLWNFRPTIVVIPHPRDVHPDHRATSYFVTEALSELQERHVLSRHLMVLTYLVHFPDWPPAPSGRDTCQLPAPVNRVPDTAWVTFDLKPAEIQRKQEALSQYQSQLAVLGDLLRRFLCRNELFGRMPAQVFAKIAAVH